MNGIESSEQPEMYHHTLQCSEVWSGYHAIENSVLSRGMRAWIWSTPYQGDSEGGDVHYLSLCSGGIVTRVALADVCGHGSAVGAISEKLCNLLRRFMNAKKQHRVVGVINREFTQVTKDFRFATAVLVTDEHPDQTCELFGRTLLDRFRDRFGATGDDDQTLIVIDFGKGRGGPSVGERLAGYGRFIKSRWT